MARPEGRRPHAASPRRAPSKGIRQIASEWDRVAAERFQQIESRDDISFHAVLLPAVDGLIRGRDLSLVLDAGCGTGFVTEWLARKAKKVVGVDISRVSIDIARQAHSRPNLTYVRSSVESFSRHPQPGEFSLAVANMTLMNVPRLTDFVRAVARLLRPSSAFVFTITHPWFWPTYWGYEAKPWFRYADEIAVEAPFTISLSQAKSATTHFHRPLGRYVSALNGAGFCVAALEEPMPPPEVQELYPRNWKFPRFLAGLALRS
jgi:predicted TPR repeat methyltransferase